MLVFDWFFRYVIPLFWTGYAIYNPITKGVMDLNVLKRTLLITIGSVGCFFAFILLISNNRPKAAESCLSLPYRIEESDIVLNYVMGYDGLFLEDRSYDRVTNVAVAVLYNSGTNFLDSVVVDLATAQHSYHFEATMIPPGECVAVQDLNRCQWDSGEVLSCTAMSKRSTDSFGFWSVDAIPQNYESFLVVNNSIESVPSVSIYHKTWHRDMQIYIGGITYKTVIRNLQAGDSLVIKPEHFTENSRIIRIE